MELTVHPLLTLLDDNANGLKLLLKNYIDFTVEKQFDRLKKSIVEMIATGQIGPQSNENALAIANSIFPTGHSKVDSVNSSILYHSNDQLTHEQITLPSSFTSALVNTMTTSPVIKQECLEDSSTTIPINVDCNDAPNDDDNDQSINVGISSLRVDKNALIDAVKEEYDEDGETGKQIEVNKDDAESSRLDETQMVGPAQPSNGQFQANGQSPIETIQINSQIQSVEPVIQQSINIASTSGLQWSGRKRITKKMFGDGQSNGEETSNKRKNLIQSNREMKKMKPQKVEEIYHEPEEEEEAKQNKVVILNVNCTEPGCKWFFNSLEMWKQHLSCHGQVPYKHLLDNVRRNQHGQIKYACTKCDKVYRSKMALIHHYKQYHQSGKFQCSDCAFVANFQCDVLSHHQKYHR